MNMLRVAATSNRTYHDSCREILYFPKKEAYFPKKEAYLIFLCEHYPNFIDDAIKDLMYSSFCFLCN